MARRPKTATPAAPEPPVAAALGEIALTLEGVRYVLRPTFEAVMAIEGGTGRAIEELLADCEAGRLKAVDAGEIVARCIQAWGRATGDVMAAAAQPRRVAELIYAEDGGLLFTAKTVIRPLLIRMLTGNYTPQGEVKPAGTTTSAPASAG